MAKKAGKIYVVGHKNPDTDSICSAIAYANLKREITGNDYIAKRAGQINEETHYVLQKFGVKVPNLLENVKLQVKDMDIRRSLNYKYFTGQDWGKAQNYDLALNRGSLGIEKCAQLIVDAASEE